MELRLIYGLLVGLGLFVAVWFVFVVPSVRRDHERRLRIVRKRIAEREQRLAAEAEEVESPEQDERDDQPREP